MLRKLEKIQEPITKLSIKMKEDENQLKFWTKFSLLSLKCSSATFYFSSNFYIEILKIIIKYMINIL